MILVKDVQNKKPFDVTIKCNKMGKLVARRNHPTWLEPIQKTMNDVRTEIRPLKGTRTREFGLILVTD